MTEEIYCQNNGTKGVLAIHTSNNRFKFFYQIASLGTGTLKSFQILDHCLIRNNFFIYRQFQIYIHPGQRYFQTYGNILTLIVPVKGSPESPVYSEVIIVKVDFDRDYFRPAIEKMIIIRAIT